jgi:lipopolysaccharide export system permease protein
MKTIRRLIYREVVASVVFVAVGFLALFFFFDFVDELPNVGKGSADSAYKMSQALGYVTLMIPNHLYELLPIAVLIGTIFVMARLAQSSEYTILRTSGLGPFRALRTLLGLGLIFTLLTFATGDYLAPVSDRTAQLLKARYEGRISIGQTGAWLKEKRRRRAPSSPTTVPGRCWTPSAANSPPRARWRGSSGPRCRRCAGPPKSARKWSRSPCCSRTA